MINYSNISNSLGCAVDEGLELNIPSELSGIEDFVDHNDVESEMYFSHTDHLGSSSFITDAGGEAVQHIQYLPFGESFISQRVSDYILVDVRHSHPVGFVSDFDRKMNEHVNENAKVNTYIYKMGKYYKFTKDRSKNDIFPIEGEPKSY